MGNEWVDPFEKAGAFLEGYRRAQIDGASISFAGMSFVNRLRIIWYVIKGGTIDFKPTATHEEHGG